MFCFHFKSCWAQWLTYRQKHKLNEWLYNSNMWSVDGEIVCAENFQVESADCVQCCTNSVHFDWIILLAIVIFVFSSSIVAVSAKRPDANQFYWHSHTQISSIFTMKIPFNLIVLLLLFLCYSLVVNLCSQPNWKWPPRWNRLTFWIGRHDFCFLILLIWRHTRCCAF